ncbi:hypothetical protein T484DRAFT_1903413, partial [Baffinella frigidus]
MFSSAVSLQDITVSSGSHSLFRTLRNPPPTPGREGVHTLTRDRSLSLSAPPPALSRVKRAFSALEGVPSSAQSAGGTNRAAQSTAALLLAFAVRNTPPAGAGVPAGSDVVEQARFMRGAITPLGPEEFVDAEETVEKRTVKVRLSSEAALVGRGGEGASMWDRWMVEHNLVPRTVMFNASATDVEVRLCLPSDVDAQALSLSLSLSFSSTLHLAPPLAPPPPGSALRSVSTLRGAFPQVMGMLATPEIAGRVRDMALSWRAPEDEGRVHHTLIEVPDLGVSLTCDAAPLSHLLLGLVPPLQAAAAAKAAIAVRVSLADAHRAQHA